MKKNDSLKKHHFWILAGLAPLLAFLTMIFLMTGPGEAKDKAAAEITKKKEEAARTQTKGKKALDEDYPKQKEVLFKQRETLWKVNYEAQKALFTWPQAPSLRQLEQKYQKFGEKIEARNEFEDFKRKEVYERAYDQAAEQIKPTTFAGGDWRRVLRHVSNWGVALPTSNQVWLALEDLWVQRSLLMPVKEVNAEAARFELVRNGQGEPPPLKRTFRSRIWEVELEVPTEGPHANRVMYARLTNRTNRLQIPNANSEIRLRVWLSDGGQPVTYRIQPGEFVKAGGEVKVDATNVNPQLHGTAGAEVQKITRVEQVLDERTVPVRQVLAVELGYKDARHHAAQLKKPDFWPEEEAAPTSGEGFPGMGMPGAPVPGGPGGIGSPDGGAPGMPPFGFGFGAAQRAGAKFGTPAQVLDGNKERYLQETPQVRRMPVALVLLVDQMFVQDALVAYANSPLRFQVTQYHWKRFRGSLSGGPGGFMPGGGYPPGGDIGGPGGDIGAGAPGDIGSPDGGDTGYGGDSGGGYILGSGGRGYGGGYGGYGPPMPGGPGYGGTTGSLSEGQLTSGLVELTIYGIVTLYKKYEAGQADGTDAPAGATTEPAPPDAGTATGGTSDNPEAVPPKTPADPATPPAGDPGTPGEIAPTPPAAPGSIPPGPPKM
jgi:hypothetical protein